MKNASGEYRRGFFGFSKIGLWFDHVTADAVQTLKTMRSRVKVMTQKQDRITSSAILWCETRFTAHEHVRVAAFALPQSGMGYHPRKSFGIPYVIWCILRQSGGSYL